MRKSRWRRELVAVMLAGSCLFSGACGITTLQLQDFATTTFIRTTVSTLAAVVESAIIAAAQEADGAGEG